MNGQKDSGASHAWESECKQYSSPVFVLALFVWTPLEPSSYFCFGFSTQL